MTLRLPAQGHHLLAQLGIDVAARLVRIVLGRRAGGGGGLGSSSSSSTRGQQPAPPCACACLLQGLPRQGGCLDRGRGCCVLVSCRARRRGARPAAGLAGQQAAQPLRRTQHAADCSPCAVWEAVQSVCCPEERMRAIAGHVKIIVAWKQEPWTELPSSASTVNGTRSTPFRQRRPVAEAIDGSRYGHEACVGKGGRPIKPNCKLPPARHRRQVDDRSVGNMSHQ